MRRGRGRTLELDDASPAPLLPSLPPLPLPTADDDPATDALPDLLREDLASWVPEQRRALLSGGTRHSAAVHYTPPHPSRVGRELAQQQPSESIGETGAAAAAAAAGAPLPAAPLVSDGALLMRRLQRCASWQQLDALVRAEQPRLNTRHVSAALCLLPKLAARQGELPAAGTLEGAIGTPLSADPAGVRPAAQHLARLFMAALPEMDARGLANGLWAFGALRLCPSLSDMQALLTEVQCALPSLNGQELANAAWALAALRHRPPPDWLFEFSACSAKALKTMRPQELANTLWALAALSYRPPAAWLDVFLATALDKLYHFNAQELSCTLAALAHLGKRPGHAWLAIHARVVGALLPSFNPRDVSSTLWAWAALGVAPPAPLLAALLRAAAPRLPTFSAQALANTAWGLARLHHAPGGELLAAFLAALEGRCGDMSPQGVANTLWALATLRAPPPAALLDALLARLQPLLPRCSAQELSNAAWALARLRLQPPPAFASAWFAATSAALGAMPPPELAACVWAAATLRLAPPEGWLAAAEQRSAALLPLAPARAVSTLAWSFAELRHVPEPPWLALLAAQLETKLAQCSAQELCMLMRALPPLAGATPDGRVQRAFLRQCIALLPVASPRDLAEFAATAVALGAPVERSWLDELASAFADEAAAAAPRDLSRMLWALSRLRYRPDPFVWDAVLGASFEAMDGFDDRALAALLPALARFPQLPSGVWLEAYYARLATRFESLSGAEVANIAWAMARLRVQPPQPLLAALRGRLPRASEEERGWLSDALQRLQAAPLEESALVGMAEAISQSAG